MRTIVTPPSHWVNAWMVFVMVEGALLFIHWLLSPFEINTRLFSPDNYLIVWLMHMVLTIVLWAVLFAFKSNNNWQIIIFNVCVFISYFVVWVAMVSLFYALSPSSPVGTISKNNNWRDILYESWPEIGRYLIKVVGFYALRYYYKYRQSSKQRIELAVINKDLQLRLLQEQLSPHFYFNTLNNLYGLALSGSEKLSDALSQLSSIMRYVIVECSKEMVSLNSEIHFIESYLALEKLRYEADTFIELKVDGATAGKKIMPMLLIQLVENAFKHGLYEKSSDDWLKVLIEIEDATLNFQVENSFSKTITTEGIGLQSLRKRLEINYPGKYQLNVSDDGKCFLVKLKLELLKMAA